MVQVDTSLHYRYIKGEYVGMCSKPAVDDNLPVGIVLYEAYGIGS